MKLSWILALCSVACCASAATTGPDDGNRAGFDRPTDKPIEISEADINDIFNNAFDQGSAVNIDILEGGGRSPTVDTSTTTPMSNEPTPSTLPESTTPVPPEPSVPPEVLPSEVPQQGNSGDSGTSDKCECVPYYLCSTNRTIIENGEGIIDIRMSTGPCDYMDVCCKIEDELAPENPITLPPPMPFISTCGVRNFDGVSTLRITGAEDGEAQFGEFPWVVAVIRKDDSIANFSRNIYQCGGSLIHPQVVLTAAHCVKGKSNLRIRAGEWDTQRKTEPLKTQNRLVQEVIIHEKFYAGGLHNDVALLILDSPVERAPHIYPICLPEQGEVMDNRNCVASGWGQDVFGKEGKYQVILKRVDLPIVAQRSCQEALRKTKLGRRFRLHESFICAGGVPGKDTCKGDGGGPLACPSPNNPKVYVQAGIIAWGVGCGTETPGVYVRVALFRNWIDNKLSMLNLDIGSSAP